MRGETYFAGGDIITFDKHKVQRLGNGQNSSLLITTSTDKQTISRTVPLIDTGEQVLDFELQSHSSDGSRRRLAHIQRSRTRK